MNKIEKQILKRFSEIFSIIISKLDENNVESLNEITSEYKKKIDEIILRKKEIKIPPIWEKFSAMTDDELKQEFNDMLKYPDVDSVKNAVKGFVEQKLISKTKKRETVVKHILATIHYGDFISRIGINNRKEEGI